MKNSRNYSYETFECKCNSLFILFQSEKVILVDPFNGEGKRDAENRHYSAPIVDPSIVRSTKDTQLFSWVINETNDKLLWRMLKFLLKGYTIDRETAITIYRYWWKNKNIFGKYPNEIKWRKIWCCLKPEDVNEIFGIDGIL